MTDDVGAPLRIPFREALWSPSRPASATALMAYAVNIFGMLGPLLAKVPAL
jgi:hypothetical protein